PLSAAKCPPVGRPPLNASARIPANSRTFVQLLSSKQRAPRGLSVSEGKTAVIRVDSGTLPPAHRRCGFDTASRTHGARAVSVSEINLVEGSRHRWDWQRHFPRSPIAVRGLR